MINISIYAAFIAGLVSFLAPCVLPLIPGFLAYLGGSVTAYGDDKSQRWQIFLNSLFFVLGFSLVFSLLGILLNTVLQNVAYDVQIWLSRVGGLTIIFFGLYLVGLIKIPFLDKEYKMKASGVFKSRYATSFLFGLAFAAGWTPCVGPALGVILGLTASNPGSAFVLLLAYSIGLGVPFLLVGLFVNGAERFIQRYGRYLQWLNTLFGILLTALGILVFTQSLSLIANFDFLNNYLIK